MNNQDQDFADTPDDFGRHCLYSVTVIASLLLLILHKGITAEWSVFSTPTVICICYSVVIGTSIILSLLINGHRNLRIIWIGLSSLTVLALLAWHTGAAYLPDVHLDESSIFLPYVFSLIIALFILTPFLQVWRDGFESLSYQRLYQLSWDNALTIVTAIVFTAAGWLLLHLLAGLFSVIGIDFFRDLFETLEFIYPVTGLFVGFGIGIGRTQIGAIRSALNVCLSIARPLLPLISAIAVLFLLALAFNNLETLWNTGTATTLLLCLILGTVTLLNAVYQDGENQKPYGAGIQGLVGIALLTLPLFSAIAAYAIYLRVGQYGWSVDRLYATLITAVSSLYSLGYAASYLHSFFKGDRWLSGISHVNIVMALLLSGTLLLTQSPALDFRNITVHSQLSRVSANQLSLNKLDLSYFRFELGKTGYRAILDLKNLSEDEVPPDFHTKLESVLAAEHRYQAPANHHEIIADIDNGVIRILPEGTEVPDSLLDFLQSPAASTINIHRSRSNCNDQGDCCYLVKVDLSDNRNDEWILIDTGNYSCRAPVFSQTADEWSLAGYLSTQQHCDSLLTSEALRAGQFSAKDPEIKNLRVGEEILRFQATPQFHRALKKD